MFDTGLEASDVLPDVIPDWVLADRPLPVPLTCDCGCAVLHDDAPVVEPVVQPVVEPGWCVPGVTGLDGTEVLEPVGLPEPSADVLALARVVERLVQADPAALPAAQALADGQALLGLQQRLRVHGLERAADVAARGLHDLLGFRSVQAWWRTVGPDADPSDARLGAALREVPLARAAVREGRVPLVSARRLVAAVRRCAPHLDRPDGLIDGQPACEVLPAVVGNVVTLICRHLSGLTDDDPRLTALLQAGGALLDAAGSQREVFEGACVLLAQHLPPPELGPALEQLVLSVLPSRLDDADREGLAAAGVTLVRKPDGSGWRISGELGLECGERLFTALRAEATRDPRNPSDTRDWQALRDLATTWGVDPAELAQLDEQQPSLGLAAVTRPRSRRRRLHDALDRLLTRYLEHGLGGTAGKTPVQVNVTVPAALLDGRPGALPAVADSGAPLPAGMLRRWWCDARITPYLLSHGGVPLQVAHSQRTLTGTERRALAIATGSRCVGIGCCPDQPDPLVVLRPHHVFRYSADGRTLLTETLPACDTTHHDLHEGKRTIRLRDGRWLNEHGFTETPPLHHDPPF